MKHRLCRIALPVFLLLALFLALAMLSANTSRRHADAQTTFSSLFGLLWIDGTLAESNPYAFVTQHEETYYVLDDTHSYVFRCQNTEQLANISDYSAAVGGRPYTLIRDENSGLYGFDFGTQSGNFDIQFSYSDHGGAMVTETLHVRVVRELGENVWYSADGWEVREDTFTAGRGAGELTILSGGEEQMRAGVYTTAGSMTVCLDGETAQLQSGENVIIPAAEREFHAAVFSYAGEGTATVTLAENKPVQLLVRYDDSRGSVLDQTGTVIAPDTYVQYDYGTPVSLAFEAGSCVSSIDGESQVNCRLESITVNGNPHAGTSFETVMTEDLAVEVSFIEELPRMPAGGTLLWETHEGTQMQQSFSAGEHAVLTDGNEITLQFAAPDVGERCTVKSGTAEEELSAADGVYSYTFSASDEETALVFTLYKEGYVPYTFSLTVSVRPQIEHMELSPQNVYERIYDEDGAIKQDFLLCADVYYTDGTKETIPLTHTEQADTYVYESTIGNASYGFSASVRLSVFTQEMAQYSSDEAALARQTDITNAAAKLYEHYLSLRENRTEAELAYLSAQLNADFAAEIVTNIAVGTVGSLSDHAELTLSHADGSSVTQRIALSEDNFMTENGALLVTGTFEAEFRGVPYQIVWRGYAEKPSVTVRVADKTSVYGDPILPLSYTIEGEVGSDFRVTLSKESGNAVGTYKIVAAADDERYEITVLSGTYTITPRPVTFTISDASVLYGDYLPKFTYSLTQGTLFDELTVILTAPNDGKPGSYPITGTVSGDAAENYIVTWVNGTLTIQTRPLTIAACDASLRSDATWADVCAALKYTLSSGTLAENTQLDVRLSVLIDGETLTEENFSSLWKGGQHTIAIEAAAEGYTIETREGTLTAEAQVLDIQAFETQFVYTGTEIHPFDWKTHLNGLLPSASVECFTVEILHEDGTPADKILLVGTYLLCISAAHSEEYAFSADTITQFEITVVKYDISDFIEINGVKENETLLIDENTEISASISEYNVKFYYVLEHGDNSTNLETITSENLNEAGLYTVRVVVEDDNYCGEAEVTFTVAESFSEVIGELSALLERMEEADAEECFSILVEIRNVLLHMSAEDLTLALQNETFASLYAQAAEAWATYADETKNTFTQTRRAVSPDDAILAATAAAVAAAVAIAFYARKFD